MKILLAKFQSRKKNIIFFKNLTNLQSVSIVLPIIPTNTGEKLPNSLVKLTMYIFFGWIRVPPASIWLPPIFMVVSLPPTCLFSKMSILASLPNNCLRKYAVDVPPIPPPTIPALKNYYHTDNISFNSYRYINMHLHKYTYRYDDLISICRIFFLNFNILVISIIQEYTFWNDPKNNFPFSVHSFMTCHINFTY